MDWYTPASVVNGCQTHALDTTLTGFTAVPQTQQLLQTALHFLFLLAEAAASFVSTSDNAQGHIQLLKQYLLFELPFCLQVED